MKILHACSQRNYPTVLARADSPFDRLHRVIYSRSPLPLGNHEYFLVYFFYVFVLSFLPSVFFILFAKRPLYVALWAIWHMLIECLPTNFMILELGISQWPIWLEEGVATLEKGLLNELMQLKDKGPCLKDTTRNSSIDVGKKSLLKA